MQIWTVPEGGFGRLPIYLSTINNFQISLKRTGSTKINKATTKFKIESLVTQVLHAYSCVNSAQQI